MNIKAPRNKTLELSPKEMNAYAKRAIKLNFKASIDYIIDKTIHQDMMKTLDYLPDSSVDLIVVDPPYNLTKVFGNSVFKERDFSEYKKWLEKWVKKLPRILKENGSLYICADWKTSISIPEVVGKYFILQNRISWEREKGRGAKDNWKNCLEDILFFTKSKHYTINLEAVKILRPVVAPYRDEQGEPKDWVEESGKRSRLTYPSNIWTDISIPFWSMPENTPHPTQKPEKLIAKLILASSNEGDVVVEPFLVSVTTAVVAKKLGRHYIGIEKEKEYVAYAEFRLEQAERNKEIQGYENGVFKSRNAEM